MKKIVTLVVALLVCLTAAFAGCGDATGYENGLNGLTGEVSSNGGFAVKKGDYVYFVNGKATHEADNTYGKVVTGALARVKATDLKNTLKHEDGKIVKDGKYVAANEKKAEIVIPSLFVAGDLTSGFYIFGNEVYYATPVNTKNKEGKVENTKLNFVKTTLDGKTSVSLTVVDDNKTQYRYTKVNDTVYLVLKTVNDKQETVIKVVNTKTKEENTTEKVENVSFADTDNFTTVYYTKLAYDDKLEQDEKFNEVHALSVANIKDDKIILNGKDKMDEVQNENSSSAKTAEDGFGLMGAKFTFVKETADTLYVKSEYVDTSITTVTNYLAINKADNKVTVINKGTASAAAIFTNDSWYKDAKTIIYLDKTYGLIKYDYEATGDDIVDGREKLFYDKDLVSYTVKFWNNGYVYLVDGDSNYFRVNVNDLLDDEKKANVKVEKVAYLASATDWYTPEIIDDCMLTVYSPEIYGSLVYTADIAVNNGLDEDGLKDIRASKKGAVELNFSTTISVVADDKKEAREKYIKDTFKDEKK